MVLSNFRETLEFEVNGHVANIIQWKRSIAISEIVIKAIRKELRKMPPADKRNNPPAKKEKKPIGVG